MNYSTDKAITNKDDDLLGRATFSNQLGKAICEYVGDDSLVIGLFGKWGSGKTSIVNMTIQTIEKHNEEIPEDAKNIIIRFAPWNYLGNSCLIKLFFDELMTTINSDENSELKKQIGDVLKNYSDIFDAASVIPVVGPVLAPAFKTAARAGGEILSKPVDLNNSKKKLNDALRNIKQRIVVVIDDIDRLTNEQIRDIFQLVKQVADFPNIIYILVMDRDIVSKALSDVSGCAGNEYLNKIIQIPFEVPELRKSKVNEIFIDQLNSIIYENTKDYILDNQYFDSVFEYCIEPYLLTLRDVNRVLNVFQFKLGLLLKELSLEDLIGITTIEVVKPELYKWIASNKRLLCAGEQIKNTDDELSDDERYKFYEAELEQLSVDAKTAMKSIEKLFPKFRKIIGEHEIKENETSLEISSKMRISNEERFDLFFTFDLDAIPVPREMINSCAFIYDQDELTNTIWNIYKNGNIAFFADELDLFIDKLDVNRLVLLSTVLIKVSGRYEDESKFGYSLSPLYKTKDLIIKMLRKVDESNRFNLLYDNLKECDVYSFRVIGSILNQIDNNRNTKIDGNPILSKRHFSLIEREYTVKAKLLFNNDEILELRGFPLFLDLWRKIDSVSANEFIESYFISSKRKLKLLCAFAIRWNKIKSKGWSFDSVNYGSFFSDDEVNEIIRWFKPRYLNGFTDVEQVKIATLVILYNSGKLNRNVMGEIDSSVSEARAKELLAVWKSKVSPSKTGE